LSASEKGVVTVTLPKLKRGTYVISAAYTGSNGVASSHSGSKKLVVTKNH
jgi:hypothetical protein